ncbi:MAG: hypothetical protein WC726_01035 [Parcubacteria group bacterium]|jgi:hypothetical protein
MDKKIIAIVAVIAVVFALVVGGMFWWMKKIEKTVKNAATGGTVQSTTAGTIKDQLQPGQETAVQSVKNNNDGMVEWYASPKLVPTPQIYSTNNDFGAKVWEVGKVVSGKNSGNTIILMSLYPEGPGGLTIARFMKKSEDGLLSLLENYSNGINISAGASDINTKVMDDYPAYGVTINSLDFPGILFTPEGEKMLKAEDFPANNIDDSLDNIFFKNNLLKYAFTDSVYGDFYTTDSSKIDENNSYSVYAKYGFYVKAPDGTFKVYRIAVDFVGQGDVPGVTWNNGQKNSSKFSYQGSSGCGISKYTDVVDSEVKMADLVAAGKTSIGDSIYEFADKNAKYLKDFYQEDINYLKNIDQVGAGIAEGKKFTMSTTYDQFANSHVVFFWKDSFGRLVRFINQDYFIDPGGCGKPVIYLYPEKTQKISVKVSPSEGFTKTEPDYGSGWNVIADSMSHLKNLADGKTYPYLFWEGKSKEVYQMPRRGFVADRDNLENLLNDKLALLGLNNKEISDFKEFWLPKMLAENKPYYFVTFSSKDEIDKLAPLEISPKPDTTIRVMMDYKGLDEKIDALGYDIKTPERKGFTAVEWGGMLK